MSIKHHTLSEENLLKSLLKPSNEGQLKYPKKYEPAIEKKCNLLKYLLVTENEIDLKKVLCLHLFAITVPPRPCRRHEVTENIVEFTNYPFYLPNYFLHRDIKKQLYCPCWEDENNIKIGKLRSYSSHLAINVTIANVLKTVLKTISKLDINFMKQLMAMSHNLYYIHMLLKNEKCKEYLISLRSLLKNKNKLRTEVCTIIRATPCLVSEVPHIKKNMVFTVPLPDNSLHRIIFKVSHTREKRKQVYNEKKKTIDPVLSNSQIVLKQENYSLKNHDFKNHPLKNSNNLLDFQQMVKCINFLVKKREDKREIKEFTEYSFILPNYFLYNRDEEDIYCKCWYNENREKIGKSRPCKIHLAVNLIIVSIIETVLEILYQHNVHDFEKLITFSHDLTEITSCLKDKQYVDYILSLNETGLFNDINILQTETCIISNATQKLVDIAHIRKNMVLSLRLPDSFPKINNLILKQINLNNISLDPLKNDIPNKFENTTTKNIPNSTQNIESKRNLKNSLSISKTTNKLPQCYYQNVKRWPFNKNEININKELVSIKRINDKYLRNYDLNMSNNLKKKYKFQRFNLIKSKPVAKKIFFTEKNQNLHITENIANKSKTVKFTESPIEETPRKTPETFIKNDKADMNKTIKYRNEGRELKLRNGNKASSIERLKSNEREETGNTFNMEKNLILQLDKNEFKNGLLKVELRSKLRKLISSVDSVINI